MDAITRITDDAQTYDIDSVQTHTKPSPSLVANMFPCAFCKSAKAHAYVSILPIISRKLLSHYALCLRGCANCIKNHRDETHLDIKRTMVITFNDYIGSKHELIARFINQIIIMEIRARVDTIMAKLCTMDDGNSNNPAYLCRCELFCIYKKMFASGFGKTRVEHNCAHMNRITSAMYEGCISTFATCADYTTSFADAIISVINVMGFQIVKSKWSARMKHTIHFPVAFVKGANGLQVVIDAVDNSYLLRSCLLCYLTSMLNHTHNLQNTEISQIAFFYRCLIREIFRINWMYPLDSCNTIINYFCI